MTEKFGISEKDELTILEHWLKDVYNNILKIPQDLEGKITEQQATNLYAHFQDLGNSKDGNLNTKVMEDRVKGLKDKFQKQKEESLFFIIKKEFKEQSAKFIVWIIMSLIGFVLGFLFSHFLR